jgi:hypothetical protein
MEEKQINDLIQQIKNELCVSALGGEVCTCDGVYGRVACHDVLKLILIIEQPKEPGV